MQLDALFHQNIDDDGGAEQRGDGIQRDDATVRRKGAEEIAEKGYGCTHQHRDGQQTAMILRADDVLCRRNGSGAAIKGESALRRA